MVRRKCRRNWVPKPAGTALSWPTIADGYSLPRARCTTRWMIVAGRFDESKCSKGKDVQGSDASWEHVTLVLEFLPILTL
jgi:hypothetical protein